METNNEQSKLSKMAEIAKQRVSAERKREIDICVRIKQEVPVMADFLSSMTKTFGIMPKVSVTKPDGEILRVRG